MSAFVKSLKRLYKAGRLDLNKIKEYVNEGKITVKEYDWIVGL